MWHWVTSLWQSGEPPTREKRYSAAMRMAKNTLVRKQAKKNIDNIWHINCTAVWQAKRCKLMDAHTTFHFENSASLTVQSKGCSSMQCDWLSAPKDGVILFLGYRSKG
jgi:hypothetical protein